MATASLRVLALGAYAALALLGSSYAQGIPTFSTPVLCVEETYSPCAGQAMATFYSGYKDCPKLCRGRGATYYSESNYEGFLLCECFPSCSSLNLTVPVDTATIGLISACSTGVEGDPHFVGAHGTHYDYVGSIGHSFCLLTDARLHINGLFGGYQQPGGALRTWIQGISLQWRTSNGAAHSVQMLARRGKEEKRGETGFLARLVIDGQDTPVPLQVGDEVRAGEGFILRLERTKEVVKEGLDRDTFSVEIQGLFKADLSLNPEYKSLQSPDDAEIHFNLNIQDVEATAQVHGVLGQTFKRTMARKLRAGQFQAKALVLEGALVADGKSGAGFLDGAAGDYMTSGLEKADCKFATAWNK